MNFKDLKNKIKEEQKQLAQKIRNGKSGRKPNLRNSKNSSDYNSLERNQFEYRHKHIVYCNMFNRTSFKDIERPRDYNRPNSSYLIKLRQDWEKQLDEVVYNCA